MACRSGGVRDMTQIDNDDLPATKKAWNKPSLKAWNRPEIRDQSIRSLTEGKPNQWPSEASPGTGS